jgi:predicted hydrolase (HD superfamily)
MINREEALVILRKYLKDADNIRYSFAVETLLRDLAKRLGRDEDLWGLVGLLHNIDYEYTAGNLEQRGTLSAEVLEGLLPENGVNAIKANHYTHTDYIPTTTLDKALIAGSAVVGLIVTISRFIPSKEISDVTIETVINKFQDPEFAARYNRSRIKLCSDIGIDLKDFLGLSLLLLQKIADDIDL